MTGLKGGAAKRLRRLGGFLKFVVRRFNEDHCFEVASALTYTTLLSLVPLLTIAITVASAFPAFNAWVVELRGFILSNLVPQAASKVITVYMEQFSTKAAGLTAIGIVALAVTALILMLTIDGAFNAIWRVRRVRPMLQRFLIYWAALTMGPLLIGGSISITTYLINFSLAFVHAPALGIFALKLMPVALTAFAFALLYRMIPNRYVPTSHALIGALVASLAFELMKSLLATYISYFPMYTLVYGAFAALPIFLLWIYLSWVTVLLGAVVAASLSHWRGDAWQRARVPGWQFYEAIRLLRTLDRARRQGQNPTLQQLRVKVHLGLEDLEELLEQLSEAGLVRRLQGNRWLLTREPDRVRAYEVYRSLVLGHDPRATPDINGLDAILSERLQAHEHALDISLSDLFESPDVMKTV